MKEVSIDESKQGSKEERETKCRQQSKITFVIDHLGEKKREKKKLTPERIKMTVSA